MRLSKNVEELFQLPTINKIQTLSEGVKRLGKTKYGSKFNETLFDASTLLQIVKRIIVLKVSIQELESLHETSQDFQNAFHSFSKSAVRTPKVGFNLIEARPCDIVFNCRSHTHNKCTEVVVDNIFCHFGDLKLVSKQIREQVARFDDLVAVLLPSALSLSYEKNLVLSDSISPLRACEVLTKAFNEHGLLKLPENIGLFIVPGTWDIVIFDSKRLASELKNTQDPSFRYCPDRVDALYKLGLGPEALKKISKWALLLGFGLKIDDVEITVSEERSSLKV